MDRREEDIISSRLIQSSWVETVQSFDPGSFRPESLSEGPMRVGF